MKKLNFQLLFALLMAIPLCFFSSCNEDDEGNGPEEPEEFAFVQGENFDVEVQGNDVVVTTTLTGNVWVTVNGTDYAMVDQSVTVNLPNKGTYSFTISSLVDGETVTSDPFEVVIEQDDLSFLDEGAWKSLTGGTESQREWVLDAEAKVLSGPMSFYGTQWDFVNGGFVDESDGDNAWSWDNPGPEWVFNNAMEAPGEEGYGVMRFVVNENGYIFEADKEKEDPETGTFSMDYENRNLTITGASILRSYKPNAEVKVDPNCEGDDCETKIVDGKEGISNWSDYKIHTLTDSVLRLAVLRDQDVHGEGEAYIVYNFVAKDVYDAIEPEEVPEVDVDWPDAPTAVEANDEAAAAKFEGSWKIKNSATWRTWYAGFWNFETGSNDAPDNYMGTNQEGNVYWDPYTPTDNDSWAVPGDSLVGLTMTFDATAGTLVITKANGDEVASGTYITNGEKITTDGVYIINTDHAAKEQHAPNTAVIAALPDAPVAGDEMTLAFYQCDDGCNKNEWVSYTFVKQ